MPEQTEQTKRAVAYVRESTEEQGRGYSPDGQRQAIARYATDHGMQLTEEYLDFETGRLADKRPGSQRLIEDAMERRFDVVLDLYELGDLDRPEYIARRDAIHTELDALAPEPTANLDQAGKVLEDFAIFWSTETDPSAQATVPQPRVRRRLARPRPRSRRPAQALVPGVLPATAPRTGGGK
jgi:hypothetical protein